MKTLVEILAAVHLLAALAMAAGLHREAMALARLAALVEKDWAQRSTLLQERVQPTRLGKGTSRRRLEWSPYGLPQPRSSRS